MYCASPSIRRIHTTRFEVLFVSNTVHVLLLSPCSVLHMNNLPFTVRRVPGSDDECIECANAVVGNLSEALFDPLLVPSRPLSADPISFALGASHPGMQRDGQDIRWIMSRLRWKKRQPRDRNLRGVWERFFSAQVHECSALMMGRYVWGG